jgi:hypothetical protein
MFYKFCFQMHEHFKNCIGDLELFMSVLFFNAYVCAYTHAFMRLLLPATLSWLDFSWNHVLPSTHNTLR